MNAHASLKPIELGSDARSVQIAARAVEVAATTYLSTPGYPECSDLKGRRWEHYQECLINLLEKVRA